VFFSQSLKLAQLYPRSLVLLSFSGRIFACALAGPLLCLTPNPSRALIAHIPSRQGAYFGLVRNKRNTNEHFRRSS